MAAVDFDFDDFMKQRPWLPRAGETWVKPHVGGRVEMVFILGFDVAPGDASICMLHCYGCAGSNHMHYRVHSQDSLNGWRKLGAVAGK